MPITLTVFEHGISVQRVFQHLIVNVFLVFSGFSFIKTQLVAEHPKVLDYIDGIAVHYYTDFITPAAVISEVGKLYPDKFIIATEACEGIYSVIREWSTWG